MPARRDKQRGYQNTDPCEAGFAITPNDSNELSDTTRFIRANGAGNVKVDMASGQTLTIPMLAGESLPIAVKKVYLTDTTATGLMGFF